MAVSDNGAGLEVGSWLTKQLALLAIQLCIHTALLAATRDTGCKGQLCAGASKG